MRSKADATGVMVMLVLRDASRQSPMARCSLISLCGDMRCAGSTSMAGMVCGRGRSEVTSRSKNVSDQFAQRLGLFVAVHHHHDVALGGLPQQHDVERLGGGGESGERLARVRIAHQPADHLLKGRVATERLKQITDRWMCHSRTAARESRGTVPS